jgi:hypothetical protein
MGMYVLTHEPRLELQAAVSEIGIPTANMAQRHSAPQIRGPRPPDRTRGGPSIWWPLVVADPLPIIFSNGFGGNTKPVCQICLKVGRAASNCWHRFDQQFQISHQPNMQTFLASSQQQSAQCPGWCPDTGAKNRVTSYLGNLNRKMLEFPPLSHPNPTNS